MRNSTLQEQELDLWIEAFSDLVPEQRIRDTFNELHNESADPLGRASLALLVFAVRSSDLRVVQAAQRVVKLIDTLV